MDTVHPLTRSSKKNANFKRSSKHTRPFGNQHDEENEGNSSIYIEGQTGLVGVNSKQLAQDLAADNCPLSIEKKKEACKREEEIKIMAPEQNKEYEISTVRSSKEDANFKSSAKDEQPLDSQDAKRSSEEDAYFKSSAKDKQPLDNQDAKELEDVDSSVSDTESQTSFIEDPEIDVIDDFFFDDYPFNKGQTGLIEELDDASDSYSKGQTNLMELYFKPTASAKEAKMQFIAYMAHVYDKLQEDDKCPLTVERKKEARRKAREAREAREESIKKMTPEQFKEYEWSILLESEHIGELYDLVLKKSLI